MNKTLVTYDKDKLIELIKQRALKFGDFTLASGQTAKFYLDCRRLTLSGEGAHHVASGMIDLMKDDWPDAVGGMAIGADPITAAVITVAWQQNRELTGFIVRKEAKQHGTGNQVEGPCEPGQRAIILEDVVTTGGSSVRAIEYAREFGLKIDKVIAIVDRQAGAREAFEKVGVELQSLVTLSDLGITP